ncbi:restriction endonuclease subunit S [Trueperella pecoris]|uniref:restriction endonuclease subunit S n=1 Tax=Trueperella pecoris TaxID=2733571 RepID=UPI00186B83CA|nr:restriction endonuclease subunit S [Trueperella pecoris]QOQ39369.1 restriction endonuclease subunit S [Trueperella pecoris]
MNGVLPRSREATDGLQPESFDSYQLLKPGHLVFKLIDLQNVSTSRVGLSEDEGLVSPAYIVVQPSKEVLPRYAYWYFMDLYFRQVFNNLGEDGVRASLGWESLKELPFRLRSIEQQERIVQYLDAETAKIDHLIAKQRELIDLTTSRLQLWREHAFWGGATTDPFLNPPDGWELLRNRHILEHVEGRSDTGEEEMLSVSHITGVTPRSMKNVTMFEAESTVGYRLVAKDDLVINTMWAWMGALGVSRYEGLVSPSYNVYRFRDPDAVNPMYFDCMYRTAAYVSLMKANSRGIWESRLRLYPEVFLRLTSLVPSKDVQERLVSENRERTAEAERLIDRCSQAIQLLQERRSALVTAAVTGQIEV